MKRREFIMLFSSTVVAWPLTARAQRQPMPVLGYLDPTSPGEFAEPRRAFLQGLKEAGYVEGDVAPSLGIEIIPIDVRDPARIERAIAEFARTANGGVIVAASPAALINRNVIVAVVTQHRLPAVYFHSDLVRAGGLISYGPDAVGEFGQAASYVDRILKGKNQRTCRCGPNFA
jgi:hypothetical protein